MTISDISGNIVAKYIITGGEANVDISKWNNGSYVFSFFDGNETSSQCLKVQK